MRIENGELRNCRRLYLVEGVVRKGVRRGVRGEERLVDNVLATRKAKTDVLATRKYSIGVWNPQDAKGYA